MQRSMDDNKHHNYMHIYSRPRYHGLSSPKLEQLKNQYIGKAFGFIAYRVAQYEIDFLDESNAETYLNKWWLNFLPLSDSPEEGANKIIRNRDEIQYLNALIRKERIRLVNQLRIPEHVKRIQNRHKDKRSNKLINTQKPNRVGSFRQR